MMWAFCGFWEACAENTGKRGMFEDECTQALENKGFLKNNALKTLENVAFWNTNALKTLTTGGSATLQQVKIPRCQCAT